MSETILEEASRIVGGERGQDYGDQLESFSRIAKAWSAVLPCDVTAEQVALCMIGLKIVRESHGSKRDNKVDIVGYTLCLEKIELGRLNEGLDEAALNAADGEEPNIDGEVVVAPFTPISPGAPFTPDFPPIVPANRPVRTDSVEEVVARADWEDGFDLGGEG